MTQIPTAKARRCLPTHAQFTEFVLSILPPHPRDVAPIWHEPRYYGYNPAVTPINDIVLSITPTTGVYTVLASLVLLNRTFKPVCFLHRPFDLDRKALPRGSLVQASHKRFDELLTVGWNITLAQRLSLEIDTAVCIQGYKGDPGRRIGLVAKLTKPLSLDEIRMSVLNEFNMGDIFPEEHRACLEQEFHGVAIMNAFGPDEVDRAVTSAIGAGFIREGEPSKLLYLTGEPKEMGLQTLKEKYTGMVAICVGHRAAEEWGIKCLSSFLKLRWPDVSIHQIFEDEQPRQREKLAVSTKTDKKPSTNSAEELSANT